MVVLQRHFTTLDVEPTFGGVNNGFVRFWFMLFVALLPSCFASFAKWAPLLSPHLFGIQLPRVPRARAALRYM